jgi:hypothetical protein
MPPQPLPTWLEQALLWLNHPVSHYWLLLGLSLAGVAALALFAPAAAPRGWQRPWVFAAAVLLALAAGRWPTWFVQDELNPDESLLIAGAITLQHSPIHWKEVDTMTAGPLDSYALAGAGLAGLPLNFFGARVFTWLLQAGALLATWAALRRLVAEPAARLGVLAPLVFWCLTSHEDFLHYSTELVSLSLLGFAGRLLASALTGAAARARPSCPRLVLSGAALGLVPFAKLQGVPPALALALIGLVALFRSRPKSGLAPAGWFVAGGVAAPALAVVVIALTGQASEAWHTYILNNLWYVQTAPDTAGPLTRLLVLVSLVPAFCVFWWGSIACAGGLVLLAWRQSEPGRRALLGASWVLLGAAIVAVLGPGRLLPHYLGFLVLPLGVLLALHLQAASPPLAAGAFSSPRNGALIIAFLLLTVVPQVVSRWENFHIYAGQFAHFRYEHPPSQAAYHIRQRAHPGDTLAMWGWRPQLYVETGLPQGTREAQTERQLSLDPAVQAYYLNRYLRDLRQKSPAWFVDAVGPAGFGYQDRARHGHETLPELAREIGAHYEFLAEIEHLRIYRRRPVDRP